jgi:predicted small secreted protein
MRNLKKSALLILVVSGSLLLTGCNANVGVGMSVGIPIGNHGYVNLGTGTGGRRWY